MDQVTAADDALITTFGRLVEAHSSLGRQLGRSLEQRAGVPHAWFDVLARLRRAEGGQVSMGLLAQQVALTSGGLTKLIDRMTDAGLVQRVPCPTDRRVSFAALTGQGQKAWERAVQVHAADLRRAFAGVDEQDLRALDAVLDRLRSVRLD